MQDKEEIIRTGIAAQSEFPRTEAAVIEMQTRFQAILINQKGLSDSEKLNIVTALQLSKKVLEYLTMDINDGKVAKDKLKDIQKNGNLSVVDKFERMLP